MSSLLSLTLFFFLLHRYHSLGCLESERLALLNFKAAETPNSDALLTWVSDRGSDCCAWEGVGCNATTGRVVQLALNGTFSHNLFNASMFLPFEELQRLDASDSYLEGWYENQGFERLSELKNLEVLILQENGFNNSIISSLGALTSLKTLDLSVNRFVDLSNDFSQGYAAYEGLSKLKKLEVLILNINHLNSSIVPFLSALTSLETLDLSENDFEGSLSDVSGGLRNMSKLKILNLSRNNFTGNIPPSLLSLKSLESLSLSFNNLKDIISGFCELKNLQYLDLSSNKFEGTLPPCLDNLTSLRMMDFTDNRLSGKIPPVLLPNLESLEYISLSQNQFQGTFSLTSPIDHKFQLRYLALSDCNLSTSSSELLNFLYNQYDLRHINISNNNLHGTFPNWLVENNTGLQSLLLGYNSLNGQIRFPLNRSANLLSIDISNNHIQGQIQTNIGDVLSNLRYLNLSTNSLQGTLPSSLGKLTSLNVLDLSSNNFSGNLPESLALGCKTLLALMLSNNKLQGDIPFSFFNLTYMTTLRLNNNQFTGKMPTDVGFINIYTIDISENLISGGIPTWIGNLLTLTTLVMRNNSFVGPIPLDVCLNDNVRYVDLSHNHISGSIPSCVMNMINVRFLHLQGNKLTGSIPKAVPQYSGLITLDLKDNNFSGTIPSWFGSLSRLRALLLNGNRFSGPVPRELCLLDKIGILDLSQNMLSGSIPSCISNITFGKIEAIELIYDDQLWFNIPTYGYTDIMGNVVSISQSFMHTYTEQEEVEFMTKSRSDTYKGNILTFMSGLDLSSNRFTGHIPQEIGALTAIRALNFSRNQLTGPIPKALSNLKQLESMDLSHNKLSGEIPSELTGIYTLAVFSVAYNNLSGRVLGMQAQFSTFGEASYEGNPFLCGSFLQKKCNTTEDSSTDTNEPGEKFGIDLVSFFVSFAVTYVMILLGFVIVLYMNPHWRRVWFSFIDACLNPIFASKPRRRR